MKQLVSQTILHVGKDFLHYAQQTSVQDLLTCKYQAEDDYQHMLSSACRAVNQSNDVIKVIAKWKIYIHSKIQRPLTLLKACMEGQRGSHEVYEGLPRTQISFVLQFSLKIPPAAPYNLVRSSMNIAGNIFCFQIVPELWWLHLLMLVED